MSIKSYTIQSVISLLLGITFFACDANYKDKQKFSIKDDQPLAIGKQINLKYTDSGRVVSNLISERLVDHSNKEFPYQEFPQGVEVHFWENDKKSTVTSDYAIRYGKTGLIDLRKNVVLITSDSLILKADQLYWHQTKKWVFTDQPYQIKFKDGSYNDGSRFDSSQDFTAFISRKNTGVQVIEPQQTQEDAK